MSSEQPRVVWWSVGVSHYVVGMFNAIVRRGNVRFEAWFNDIRIAGRSWDVDPAEWEFPARVIPMRSLLGRPLQVPAAEIREVRPELMVSGYWTTSWILGSFAAMSTGARTVFYSMPTFAAWSPRSRGKEILKHFLFRAADGVAVPEVHAEAYARHYGMPPDRIRKLTKSIDVKHYSRVNLDAGARERARRTTGLRGCVFLYVGRLWSGKGLDFLFEAYREVRRRMPNVSLLIVGDGVEEGRYREMVREMPDVVFAGFVQPRNLPEFYGLADVLIFPTLGDPHGLVVEEAMAAGLPVICTDSAGGIRYRLPDEKAGYIVPARDSVTLAQRMLRLADDPEIRLNFGREAEHAVRDRNHEHFAADFESFVEMILSKPRRRTPAAIVARRLGSVALAANHAAGATPLANLTAATEHRENAATHRSRIARDG